MTTSDLSHNNVGEAVYKDGVYQYEIIHDFDWDKSIAQGVDSTIIKVRQGNTKDPACDRLMTSCKLDKKGGYDYLDYCRTHYTLGQEVAWGQKQAQMFLEDLGKHSTNIKAAIDFEQNAKWEKLDNTEESNFALTRALTINLAMTKEIERLMGYWPMQYTNGYLTRYMKDFVMCPLWISDPEAGEPHFSNWLDYDLHQFTWIADGILYGNYTGNSSIDLSKVKHWENIMTTTPIPEPEPTPLQSFADVPPTHWAYEWIEKLYALGITSGTGKTADGRLLFSPDKAVTRAQLAVMLTKAIESKA